MKKLISWLVSLKLRRSGLKWLDANLVKILTVVFIFLIPLYPKLPLRMINYTYIAIRMEDLFMVIYLGIYLIQLLRKKTTIDRRFFILFALYWLAVLASSFYAVYIAKTITVKHLAFLHAFRRVEYMSVFLIALSVIKSKKDFIFYIGLILAAFLIVNIYGLGQKFLGWPAVQTMNPEYAKGYLLFLTPEARISSTFSGHYDLAAYLIFLMPIVLGFYFLRSSLKYFLLFIASLLILVFTASRVSYGSYILSTFPFLLFLRKPKHFFVVLLFTLIFTLSSNNLTSRFKRTFQVKQIFVNQQTGQVVIPQAMTSKELPAGSFYIGLKQSGGQQATDSIPKQDELLKERILDEIRTEARSKGKKLSSKEERDLTASIAAKLKPINTVVSDISFATRLQVEWPRAINAFLFNPILGTGPSSITEATDNDYLRSLGEVGLLGTLLLGLIFFIIAKTIIIAFIKMKTDEKYLYGGFLFGLLGLLVNATYIDVFEASKIAFQFWFIAGLFIGFLPYAKAKK